MKILVTGSAGFIGFHLCRRLLGEGHQLAGVDSLVPYYDPRLKEKRHALLIETNRFRPHIVDISDMAAIRAVIEAEAPEVIIHLAAQPGVRYGLEHPEGYVSANVIGSFNLLEICRHRPVQHFLMASTSSVYGANSKMPFQETDPTDTPLSIYAATKRSAEAIAHSYAHLWNQPITVFRFFTVYGPWGRPDMAFFKFTAAILKGEPIDVHNHGKMERDFTYIDDLIEGIVRLIPKRPVRASPSTTGIP
jgi:UDP-glucuronate 4-epimerase